ncbi:MAG: DUF5985 family protein [Candidatus Woesearchaeota archaeon]
MSHIFLTPSWFYSYDAFFHIVCTAIALVLAIFSFKLFRLTDQRQAKLFGLSFLLISAAYFIKALFNFAIISVICQEGLSNLPLILSLDYWGTYLHNVVILSGFLLLLYMTFCIENKHVLAAMISFALIAIAFSENPFAMFYLISTVCLLFISWHFVKNYFRQRRALALISALAFISLMLGNAHFFISVSNESAYVVGHLLELLAYVLILINFYMVFRK